MLNVPEEVKALFKRDDVYKNFRVHFPNGETADFDNSSIVSESVKFTESLCSQQSFRFGLTEASQISFTAVNIPNIRGVTIECALDIDVSSLGMTWINANLSPDGFDFLSLACYLNDSEDGGFYRIPYGRFIVDTCPRNHETMYKRDVTAYTERMNSETLTNPFQTQVLNSFYPVSTYSGHVEPLTLSVLAKSEEDILNAGYTRATLQSYGAGFYSLIGKTLKTTSDETLNDVMVQLNYSGKALADTADITTALYTIDWGNFENTDAIQVLADALESSPVGLDAEASGYDSFYAMAMDFIGNYYLPGFVHLFDTSVTENYAYVPIPKNTDSIMYPYVSAVEAGASKWGLIAGYLNSISITYRDGSAAGIIAQIFSGLPTVTYTAYVTSADAINSISLNISSTLQTERKGLNGGVVKQYSFANAFSLGDIVQGYLELQCKFGSPARVGGMEITSLDNSNPVELLPDNYSDLWYDETTISPIGYVQVKFKDETGNEQDLTVQIGSGSSVYDLRDNEVLNNMVFTVSKAEAEAGITIESKLLAFLNSVFTPNIPDLTFVPIELSKKGLPYLEAGDAIEIETEDGQIVPSFILRQTITGIQFLSADVESSNGEAMEMIET